MSASPESLADERFWSDYWRGHDPVRVVDRGFYFGDLLTRALEDVAARTFVELGGYPGHAAVFARKYLGLEPTLLDAYVDRDAIAALLARNQLGAHDVTVVEADMFADAPPAEFDIVLSSGLIEHFVDVERVLRRHLDFLAPGGLLIVTLPNYRGVNGWLQRRFDPEHLAVHNLAVMELDSLRSILGGFELESFSVGYYGRFRVWLEKLGARPLWVRSLVYAIQAVGLPVALVHVRSRWMSPHIAIVARNRG